MINKILSDIKNTSVIYTGLAGLMAKSAGFLLQIVSIPLLSAYLGKEDFGTLLTVLSVTLFLNISDIGLGMNLQNRLPYYENTGFRKEGILLFMQSFIATAFISSLLFIILTLVILFTTFKNSSPNGIYIYIIVSSCFCLFMPFSLINKYYSVKLKAYIPELFNTISSITITVALFFVVKYKASIGVIAFVYQGTPLVIVIISFWYFFFIYKIKFFEVIKFNFIELKNVLKESFKYMVIPISVMLISAPDSFIIMKFVNSGEVVTYNILLRFAYFFIFPVTMFINPLLPSMNSAIVNKDFDWIKKKIYYILILLLILSFVYSILILLCGNIIIHLWLGNFVSFGIDTWIVVIIYILYSILNALISVISLTSILNEELIKVYFKAAIITTCTKIIFLYFYKNIGGFLVVSIVTMSLFFILPIIFKIKKKIYDIE
jgi:O-antigen/teichoic acid export membrane protein